MDVIITIHIPGLAGLLCALLERLPHGGQAKLAKEAKCGRETVSNLKRGKGGGIRFETLAAIAKAAGWTLNDLSIPIELLEEGHMHGRSMALARWLFNAISVDGAKVELTTDLLLEEADHDPNP